MGAPIDPFVVILAAEQSALGLTDGAFSRRIGVRREHWSRLRRGLRELGASTIRSVLAHVPHRAGPHLPATCTACLLVRALTQPIRLAS